MISHFFNIPFTEVEDLPITQYKKLIEQAFNLLNAYRFGEFNLQDSETKKNNFLQEIEMFKKQGKL